MEWKTENYIQKIYKIVKFEVLKIFFIIGHTLLMLLNVILSASDIIVINYRWTADTLNVMADNVS